MRSPLRIIHSCRRLSYGELLHAARALGWLTLARGALRIRSYRSVSRLSQGIRPRRHAGNGFSIDQCRLAMRRALVLTPRASCLARAVAAECLLRRDGHDAALSLGVRLDERRRLTAHAWLQSNGVAITGYEEAADYLPLTPPRTS